MNKPLPIGFWLFLSVPIFMDKPCLPATVAFRTHYSGNYYTTG